MKDSKTSSKIFRKVMGKKTVDGATTTLERLPPKCGVRETGDGKQLLEAVYQIFTEKKVKKMKTRQILKHLHLQGQPWVNFRKGKPIGARWLNSILKKGYGLHSENIRFNAGVFKGFRKKEVVKVWKALMQ